MGAATPWKEAGVVVAVKLLVGARTLRTGVAREKFEEGRKCKEKGQKEVNVGGDMQTTNKPIHIHL